MDVNSTMEISGWCPSENTQRQMNNLMIKGTTKGMMTITGVCKNCGNSAKRVVCMDELSFLMPVEMD
ncbi:Hypothetical protein PACV_258 [Pacmanvirus A23]|uniref:Hypothetical protein n=1 Tax=Pacmanvirus A23 TaxID=1932881 RepID=UPI000A094DBD|nr:Hypothetical protein B9W72_gp256 [Pacmanvirus A23]SIP85973.1 Hypothetical protein PACV_258 [Pacmanvirus A23]